MARQESDREDLLREATALVERIELAPHDAADVDPVVVGFRRDGALSVYFGADPAYHFNAAGELRRAFASGLLYKAVDGQLVSLQRFRTAMEVELQSRSLTAAEQNEFLSSMRDRLHDLANNIQAEKLTLVGQVPEETDVLGRVARWLGERKDFSIAAAPHAR